MTIATTVLSNRPTDLQTQRVSNLLNVLMDRNWHALATFWRLERPDGMVFRFTSHTKKVTIEEHPLTGIDGEYTPVGGFEATATEKNSNLKERNFDMRGIFDSSAITDDDLRAGLFHESELTEFVTDWRWPWIGSLYLRRYWLRSVASTGEGWQANLVGISSKLREATGKIYSRNCMHELGVLQTTDIPGTCNVDLTGNDQLGRPLTVSGIVSSVQDKRWRFLSSNLAGSREDGWFAEGKLTWTAGNNAGTGLEPSPVRAFLNGTGEFQLSLKVPFDIETGDTFDVHAGCNHTADHCKNKFNNFDNHGGFPHIPGTDKAFERPNSKV